MPDFIATTPDPPYYAVVFTSRQGDNDPGGYDTMASKMVELASSQPGYLGIESVRGADGAGITVSYWRDLEAIREWRDNIEHRAAQDKGRSTWYREYRLRISRVESEYGWNESQRS